MGGTNQHLIKTIKGKKTTFSVFLERGQNVPIFDKKRVLLDSIEGRLGALFQTLPKMSSKKACLGVNWRQNCMKFLFRGAFPREEKLQLRYVLETSGHACVQH